MTFGNYLAKTIGEYPETRSLYERAGFHEDLVLLDDLYSKLKTAQVFRLPERGMLFERDHMRYRPSIMRLPYPCVALEYHFDEAIGSLDGTGLVPASRRLIVAWQGDDKFFGADGFYSALGDKFSENEFRVGLFLAQPSGREWGFAGGLLLNGETLDWSKLSGLPFHFAHQMMSSMGVTPDEVNEAVRQDLGYEIEVLMQFLCALECKNVRISDAPPPPRLQSKRARSGHLPLISYKVLTLDAESGGGNGRPGGGTHLSPRAHLRRGHIRRLPSGNIWVNATVVKGGSNGIVLKDYRMPERAAA